jgi:MFS family permease
MEKDQNPTSRAAGTRSLHGLIGVLSTDFAALSASRLLAIAVPWFGLVTTGSVVKTGIATFCQIVPFVVSQPLVGPVIDRIGPRRVSIGGDLISMTAMIAIGSLSAAGLLHLWELMALLAVQGGADGPAVSAKAVFIPSVSRAARISLVQGSGLITAIERTATVAGPAAGGLLIAAFGAPQAFWLAAALLGLAAAVAAITLRDPVPDPARLAQARSERYLERLRQGATFLHQEKLLRAIVGMLVATNLLDAAFMSVLLPAWARASGHGAATVGLVVSVFAATSVIAAIFAARFGDRLPRRAVYMIGFVIGGIPRFIAMAIGLPLGITLAVFAIGGLGSGFINPIIGAVTFERIPAHLLGRVRTLTEALSWAGIPFGGLFAAVLIGLSGLTGALLITGGFYLAAIVLPGLRPEWSQMRKPPPAAVRSPEHAVVFNLELEKEEAS